MSKPTESEASILFRICGQKDAEIERLRSALAAAEAKLELQGYEYTKALAEVELALGADIHALDAELADERKHALDLWYLAAGLHDDDSYYGNGRKAPERLARAGEALGWPDGMRQFYVDVTGYEPEEAARRAAEVGNG